MTIILIRTWILYAVVIFSVRLMGKRQLGELQPSELVITILVSNIATLSLEDTEIPLLHGILPILLLVCFEVLVSWLTLKSVRMRRLVSGSPQVIIRGGVIDQQKLHELRFSLDDLMTSLRTAGIFSASEVQYAVVETNGTVSVMQKPAYQPAEKGDVGAASPAADPPQMLVADGQLREEALQALGRDKAWLESLLHGAGIRLQEVFLLTADRDGVRTLTRKEAAA